MRIDGWKAIARYLGRDRSTVMRWANERAMPVHRIPGGKRGSLYALTEELDAWMATRPDDDVDPAPQKAAPELVPEPSPASYGLRTAIFRLRPARIWLIVPLLLAMALSAFALQTTPRSADPQILPQNPTAAALFLEARADWARRNTSSIDTAIAKLQKVVTLEPSFAPAYVALADCHLLSQEFGSAPPAEAFGRAQDAIDAALRIDPANAAALRAKGFTAYWWRRDGAAARESFELSLGTEPDNAQTHFWYGNALIDNGDFAAGLEHLDRARLLEPVSVALQADHAWALWSAGEESRSLEMLEALRDTAPGLATIRDYLAVQYLANGDVPAFVAETAALAEIRGDPQDIAEAEALKDRLAAGRQAVLALFVDQTMADFATGDRKTLVWPAFVASMANDRDEVLRLLEIAAKRREVWGSAGLTRQMTRRWSSDETIARLLASRRPPSMVAPAS